uniref:ribosomal protein S11 n=1 Tax=Nitzschia dissipata TaxID=303402 RepID=UPI0020287A3D|nr:ribosomal protein S11 [Nitzschia dissipata]QYB23056.1 ribosomal protein S11 [Nitzschia dissipata]
MLSEKLSVLEKNSNYKKFSLNRTLNNSEKHFKEENFLIVYTITITFLKANTNINVSDIKGNVKLSFTSGSVNLIGKQKRNRIKSVSRLISLLAKKGTFLKNCPVSIHLYNVSSHKFLILNKLKNNFFIRLVKSFNQSPYNGCRKKKVRRKKYVKKFK